MSDEVAAKVSPTLPIALAVGVVLIVGGVIGNVVNQRAVWADVSSAPLHTLPIHAITGFSFNTSVLPGLIVNQSVQLVCQVAMVVGLVVFVAAIAYQVGRTHGRRIVIEQ